MCFFPCIGRRVKYSAAFAVWGWEHAGGGAPEGVEREEEEPEPRGRNKKKSGEEVCERTGSGCDFVVGVVRVGAAVRIPRQLHFWIRPNAFAVSMDVFLVRKLR